MATYTRAQLRNAVLRELGVLAVNETPTAEDADIADDRCQQELEYLAEEGYVQFDIDAGAIPARSFMPLAWVIAYNLMMPYGVTNRAQLLASNYTRGLNRLSRMKSGDYFGDSQVAEYF
jgi:hypothetical protein